MSLPRQIKLISSGETMKCRKIKAVITYHTPNKRKEPEVFFLSLTNVMLHGGMKQAGVVKKELLRPSFMKEMFKL